MDNQPFRLGIILASLGEPESTALKYLILNQNVLQKSIEFQILPTSVNHGVFNKLTPYSMVDRSKIMQDINDFEGTYYDWLRNEESNYGVLNDKFDGIVIVSLARFSDRYYLTHAENWAILALGYWKGYMAPPSVLEFVLTALLMIAVDFACGDNWPIRHHATKGCAFDFAAKLSEARFKALTGFVCSKCTEIIKENRSEQFVEDIFVLAKKDWLGSPKKPTTASITTKKLGYDLFLTKGVKPTFWEKVTQTLEEDVVKNVLKIIGALIIAALLAWLGLKKGS